MTEAQLNDLVRYAFVKGYTQGVFDRDDQIFPPGCSPELFTIAAWQRAAEWQADDPDLVQRLFNGTGAQRA